MKKIFKKITWLSAIMTLCLGLGVAASCGGGGGDDNDTSTPPTSEQPSGSEGGSSDGETSEGETSEGDSSEENEPPELSYSYRVSVQTPTDYGMGNVTVHLVDEMTDEIIATEITNSSGFAYFMEDEVPPAEYVVLLEDITPGYQLCDSDITIYTQPWGGETVIVNVEPTGELLGDEIPSGTRYQLGNVMHDFTVTTTDGKTLTLSTLLETKEVVLLNFWATWCGPCEAEFPAIDNSIRYEGENGEAYPDKVAVIAISIESKDTASVITQYKTERGLELDMVSPGNDGGLINAFYSGVVPLSVMIDRYGVITFMHAGSMTEAKDFQQRYDYFLGDDYEPYIIKGDGTTDVPSTDILERVEVPQSSMDKAPTLTGVANVLGKDGFTYRWQKKGVVTSDDEGYDPYSWPWYIANGNEYLEVSNHNINYSYATLYVDFVAEANTALAFDYKLGSEEMYDEFIVLIDGVPIHQLSGNYMNKWNTCYAYVFREFEAGEHELALIYNKNTSGNVYGDTVQIKNLRFESLDDMISAPGVDANVFRHAASVKAADGAATQFERYITPVYNEVDGYYHVGTADGPLLFANLWYTSLWCTETSLWMLAYNNFIYDDLGINYIAEVEYYAWEANNNMYNHGYTPVTQDLKDLLDLVVEYVWQYNAWGGEYHEKEWLELCVYYDHYGDSEPMQDPMRGISYQGAIQVYEGDNKVNVPFPMTPRGFKHKFIPETSGIYDIRSTGNSDTICWLVDSDRKTFLGTYDNPFFVEGEYDYNFNFRYYMEAGKTYYLLLTFAYTEEVGSFNLNITKSTDTSYSYFEHASLGQYSFNEVSGNTFLADGIEYTYSEEDEFYHVVNSDGSIGKILYLDVNRPTVQFPSESIYSYCQRAVKFEDPTESAFYVDGVDYTATMLEICERAMENEGKLKGFIAVDKEIYDLLNTILLSEKHDGVEDTWLCVCYYERVLAEGAQNPTIPTPFL